MMQVVPNSQYYESLDQIVAALELLGKTSDYYFESDGGKAVTVFKGPPVITVDFIVIGIKNSIERGFVLSKSVTV